MTINPKHSLNDILPVRHPPIHWEELYKNVISSSNEIPLYQKYSVPTLKQNRIDAKSIQTWLATLPVLTKKEVRLNFPKNLLRKNNELSNLLNNKKIEIVTTSGSTSEVLQVMLDSGWWDNQLLDALRLNSHAKKIIETKDYRFAVLTTPICSNTDCHISPSYSLMKNRIIDGVLYLNKGSDPSAWDEGEYNRMIDEWNSFKPTWIEVDPAYLSLLCEYAIQNNREMFQPEFIISTYELMKRAYRKTIKSVFNAPIYQMYGATEAGILFMECGYGVFHHNSKHSHVEFVQVSNELYKPYVTTIGRSWMPLIRYELNDYVRIHAKDSCPCGLGSDGYIVESIEGRIPESVEVDGQIITSSMLDKMIFETDNSIHNWHLTVMNSKNDEGMAHLKMRGSSSPKLQMALEKILKRVVITTMVSSIKPEISGKFKAINYE